MSINIIPVNAVNVKDSVLRYLFQTGASNIKAINKKQKEDADWHRRLMDSLFVNQHTLVPVHAFAEDELTREHE